MKRKISVFTAVFCGLAVVFTGCQPQAPKEETNFPAVGVYSSPGYAPSQEDIREVPYSYEGRGNYFSAGCRVRILTEEERRFAVSGKELQVSQIEQLKEDYPERAAEYQSLAEKLQGEAAALQNAENLYVTEIYGEYTGEAAFRGGEIVWYSISIGG